MRPGVVLGFGGKLLPSRPMPGSAGPNNTPHAMPPPNRTEAPRAARQARSPPHGSTAPARGQPAARLLRPAASPVPQASPSSRTRDARRCTPVWRLHPSRHTAAAPEQARHPARAPASVPLPRRLTEMWVGPKLAQRVGATLMRMLIDHGGSVPASFDTASRNDPADWRREWLGGDEDAWKGIDSKMRVQLRSFTDGEACPAASAGWWFFNANVLGLHTHPEGVFAVQRLVEKLESDVVGAADAVVLWRLTRGMFLHLSRGTGEVLNVGTGPAHLLLAEYAARLRGSKGAGLCTAHIAAYAQLLAMVMHLDRAKECAGALFGATAEHRREYVAVLAALLQHHAARSDDFCAAEWSPEEEGAVSAAMYGYGWRSVLPLHAAPRPAACERPAVLLLLAAASLLPSVYSRSAVLFPHGPRGAAAAAALAAAVQAGAQRASGSLCNATAAQLCISFAACGEADAARVRAFFALFERRLGVPSAAGDTSVLQAHYLRLLSPKGAAPDPRAGKARTSGPAATAHDVLAALKPGANKQLPAAAAGVVLPPDAPTAIERTPYSHRATVAVERVGNFLTEHDTPAARAVLAACCAWMLSHCKRVQLDELAKMAGHASRAYAAAGQVPPEEVGELWRAVHTGVKTPALEAVPQHRMSYMAKSLWWHADHVQGLGDADELAKFEASLCVVLPHMKMFTSHPEDAEDACLSAADAARLVKAHVHLLVEMLWTLGKCEVQSLGGVDAVALLGAAEGTVRMARACGSAVTRQQGMALLKVVYFCIRQSADDDHAVHRRCSALLPDLLALVPGERDSQTRPEHVVAFAAWAVRVIKVCEAAVGCDAAEVTLSHPSVHTFLAELKEVAATQLHRLPPRQVVQLCNAFAHFRHACGRHVISVVHSAAYDLVSDGRADLDLALDLVQPLLKLGVEQEAFPVVERLLHRAAAATGPVLDKAITVFSRARVSDDELSCLVERSHREACPGSRRHPRAP
eukprot:TRINITY_DN29666_c0_g1_i1.p1 TRINITY_DN29666_c0_g1~~TRINITY_DN29666_c0_g1_i1.p1  ORF type:complete len:978 (+),score=129.17 TRINITY_DN29666_c0_g1_i1:76-3009(+)